MFNSMKFQTKIIPSMAQFFIELNYIKIQNEDSESNFILTENKNFHYIFSFQKFV